MMKEAEKKLLENLEKAQYENDERHILYSLKLLTEFYENQSDYKQSLFYYKQFHKFELEYTNKELEEKKKDLLDSIRYAYRIQTAISPPEYLVNKLLPQHFVLYLPKDVVSGDFYFVSEFKDTTLFAAVDCTGHGVPGALMSVIGFNGLIQGVQKENVNTPAELLSFLDEYVNDVLRQTHDESGVKDSMDLAVCTINYQTKELMYAGAYNPLYYVKKNEIFEIKADKLPIGVNTDGVVDIYTNHTVQLETGDTAYIFSDGYADQFGGPKNKKFKYRQLKDIILSVQDKPMKKQGEILKNTLVQWQGQEDQIDDILVMGIKV